MLRHGVPAYLKTECAKLQLLWGDFHSTAECGEPFRGGILLQAEERFDATE
jgi:hypothetical protein